MSTGKKWATKSPTERVMFYFRLVGWLRDMANALDNPLPGEVSALHLAARGVGAVGARTQSGLEALAKVKACCLRRKRVGKCNCVARV